jgi:hypothetical protein
MHVRQLQRCSKWQKQPPISVAAGLVQTAADLKEQVGELALPASARPPDVQPGNKEAGGTRNSQQS